MTERTFEVLAFVSILRFPKKLLDQYPKMSNYDNFLYLSYLCFVTYFSCLLGDFALYGKTIREIMGQNELY
jgi:hypothetical protein